MISRFQHQGIHWIDLENPTSEEVEQVAQEFDLGEILPQDLLAPTLKPRADLYPRFAYAVLHFPAGRHTGGASSVQEVDFVIGDKFILTAHYDTVPAVYDFTREFEAASLLRRAENPKFKSGHILLELMERLYSGVEDELESLEDSIAAIEERIFAGYEREMVVAISNMSRELLNHKRTLAAHKDILDSLEQMAVMTLGEEFGVYLRGVKSFHARVFTHALSLADVMDELRETNIALLSTRQNEIMKNLTVMTFFTAPLALTAAIFGMTSPFIPLVNEPNGFWIILLGMALLTSLFLAYFKLKKWL